MKDALSALLESSQGIASRHIVREFLQVRLLEGLQDAGATASMAFHGGTALRLLFMTPRFSEDLDFALLPARDGFDFTALGRSIASDLKKEGYDVEIAVKTSAVVKKAFVKFRGLLYEMGVSPLRDETMMIKMEVDTNPPAGATVTTSRVPRPYGANVRVLHHDQASLFAGKIAAVLTREWVKGRDVFDLVWYASNRAWPAPNLAMLNASVLQSGWSGPGVTHENWRGFAWERLSRDADWESVRTDVERFVLKTPDVASVTAQSVREALGA
ncbi:MAG: nucleotidyl transferase AbiEii/AbiGii toxin family protein [Coriobacteriia bacterium]|nr:nucleotidyl transferase AbiEii/AbiGii toxin family protein [Coriobacteriia bacterium]